MKAMIIYKGKYGATQQYAEWLGEALQLPVYTPDNFDAEKLHMSDLVIAGGSIYMGRWQLHDWLFRHTNELKNKKLFLFIVCGTSPNDKEALHEIARQNIPAHLLTTCPIHFLHGRMIVQHLSWKDKLMIRMGAWLTKDPVKKKAMLQDFDDVKKDNIEGLLKAIRYERDQSNQ